MQWKSKKGNCRLRSSWRELRAVISINVKLLYLINKFKMVQVETKKIGGSICIFIPNKIVNKEKLRPNQKIDIKIRKIVDFDKISSLLKKDFKKWTSPEKVLKETDESENE